ncbi:hypothetical protein IQ254_22940 [Nodosilinea sp. LEGE 07088]|uniref:hypothetical protein n=1 Tax=Nodosilinea sp. LEGE 07088 TaxID=2777968 RepID=UPI0018830420|nr:hypothetical protein [Nodosilinea sp. LEGE 07088]MBE9140017.1 hypothetical protein [Nodosilinea sp. LEGE 07088]
MSHNSFILSPVDRTLEDAISASMGIGSGIETYPLCDYIMQSVFLKMTGSQEQKMKCICWELATNDYEYRYARYTQSPLGECSNYKDKNNIYKDLIQQIEKHISHPYNTNEATRIDMLCKTKSSIDQVFSDSNLLIWAQKSFYEYCNIWRDVTHKYFATNSTNLFSEVSCSYSLKKMYENHLYKYRNRIAHNTQSYQQNLPTLKTLEDDYHRYENYFIYFAILILIDNIFTHIYRDYLQTLEEA